MQTIIDYSDQNILDSNIITSIGQSVTAAMRLAYEDIATKLYYKLTPQQQTALHKIMKVSSLAGIIRLPGNDLCLVISLCQRTIEKDTKSGFETFSV